MAQYQQCAWRRLSAVTLLGLCPLLAQAEVRVIDSAMQSPLALEAPQLTLAEADLLLPANPAMQAQVTAEQPDAPPGVELAGSATGLIVLGVIALASRSRKKNGQGRSLRSALSDADPAVALL
ncbi:MAG: hypothetical protein V4724_04210 [Pseudomonadota bacterium]